jgi:hypothetical protein
VDDKEGHFMKALTSLLGLIALIAAACGSSSTAPGSAAVEDPTPPGVNVDELVEDPEGFADDLVDSLEEQQNSQGGGSATLVVGDQTWTFGPVLCAFGPDEIGQEGAEFVLSAIQDGLQMYVSIDNFGTFITLDDIKDFENPAVSIGSSGGASIEIDGKSVSADAEFIDSIADAFATIPGTFEATCP